MPAETPLEIERKYLIARPSEALLRSIPGVRCLDITQTYLIAPPHVSSERVRMIREGSAVRYTHTVKRRLSATTAEEAEEEIGEEAYHGYLRGSDPRLTAIQKRRYRFFLDGQCYEVDLYPFWGRTAVLETELDDESKTAKTPPFLRIIRDVTGEKMYSNHALAGCVPPDPSL